MHVKYTVHTLTHFLALHNSSTRRIYKISLLLLNNNNKWYVHHTFVHVSSFILLCFFLSKNSIFLFSEWNPVFFVVSFIAKSMTLAAIHLNHCNEMLFNCLCFYFFSFLVHHFQRGFVLFFSLSRYLNVYSLLFFFVYWNKRWKNFIVKIRVKTILNKWITKEKKSIEIPFLLLLCVYNACLLGAARDFKRHIQGTTRRRRQKRNIAMHTEEVKSSSKTKAYTIYIRGVYCAYLYVTSRFLHLL